MASNAAIAAMLDELRNIAEILGETYREKAYRMAASAVRGLQYELRDRPPAVIGPDKVPHIGQGIADKIEEFLRTGRVADLDKYRRDKRIIAHGLFMGIMGVGPATARDWVAQGIRDLPGLRKAIARGQIELTKMQKYGLKYYTDLQLRIPRDEVTRIGEALRGRIIRGPGVRFEVAGSYRRGTSDSGDVDILVSGADPAVTLGAIEEDPAFIDSLSVGAARITFLYKPGQYARQVDILFLPPAEWAPALLYFTGSWDFNEAMRGWAKRKGMLLNQHGLYAKGQGKCHKLRVVPTATEESIFAALGLRYVPPTNRTSAAAVVPLAD